MISNQLLRAAALVACSVPASIMASETATDVQCDGCVDTQDIAPGAVTTSNIAGGAINNVKLAPEAVGTAKIKDAAVTANKLGAGSVRADAIQSGAVTTDKIKNGSVGLKKISNTVREHVTLLEYASTATRTGVSGSYVQIREIGTFEKLFNTSTLELDWIDHARWQDSDADGEGFCDFQPRLDGEPMPSILTAAGTGRAVLYGHGTENNAPVSHRVFYTDLAKGIYTLTVWVRGSRDDCTLNRGNFARYVIVRERNEVLEMPNPAPLGTDPHIRDASSGVIDGAPVR